MEPILISYRKKLSKSWFSNSWSLFLYRKESIQVWLQCLGPFVLKLVKRIQAIANKNSVFTWSHSPTNKNNVFTWPNSRDHRPATSTCLVFTVSIYPLMQMSFLHKIGSSAHTYQALWKWQLDKQDSACIWNLVNHCNVYYTI